MHRVISLARPQFLIAGTSLFILGAAWAVLLGAQLSWLRLLLGYLILLTAQLSVSFSNDYFDLEVDRRGTRTFFSGGSGVLVRHPELRRPAKRVAVALTLISLGAAVVFSFRYSYPLWFLGSILVSNLLGWAYSAPPFRLAYRGLGELSIGIVAGLLLPGLGYLVMTGYMDGEGLLLSFPLLLYGMAFNLIVEIPDEEADRLGNKRTWVARIGRDRGFAVIEVLFLAATAYFFCLWFLSPRPYPLNLSLLSLLSLLPLTAGAYGMAKRPLHRKPASTLATWMVISLAVFFVLVDGYLVCLVIRPTL